MSVGAGRGFRQRKRVSAAVSSMALLESFNYPICPKSPSLILIQENLACPPVKAKILPLSTVRQQIHYERQKPNGIPPKIWI